MVNIKYITYVNNDGLDIGIMFPDTESHDVIARKLNITDNIIGAGFCDFHKNEDDDGMITCYGHSVSLNKESTNRCSYIMSKMFFGTTRLECI